MTAEIKIMADPVSNASCKFTVDRPGLPRRLVLLRQQRASDGFAFGRGACSVFRP